MTVVVVTQCDNFRIVAENAIVERMAGKNVQFKFMME